ncbi:Histone-lysine N-methyltransferase set9 [Xylographa trunciseda]|nr:Histone-lysine N-methyltransferase set9 [Xylographa trunciseda]
MSFKDSMARKERLTLTQLASYDDILTDVLVDHVYFWTTIRKNRAKYNLTRGISEDDITNILLHEVIVCKDVQHAEYHLLRLPGLRKFVEKLKTVREKEDFKRHMRKYISIWLPDCPFEVSTTNRYTIVTQEAATTARRFIKKGETIRYLCGNLVAMTSEEEKDLDLTRRDFSIVMSSRKKTPSLFLGPARFANHDCSANARLVTKGSDGMEVVAIRNIEVEEEITVTYGDDYFGIGNCECLCRTCELEGRNGWVDRTISKTTSGISTPSIQEVEENAGPYSFRNKRKYTSYAESIVDSAGLYSEPSLSVKRRKSRAVRLSSAEDGPTKDSEELTDGNINEHGSSSPSNSPTPSSDRAAAELSEDELCQDPLIVLTKVDPMASKLLKTSTPGKKVLDRANEILTAGWGRSGALPPCRTVEESASSPKPNDLPKTPSRVRYSEVINSHTSSDAESVFDRERRGTSSPASTPCRNHEETSTPLLENIETEKEETVALATNVSSTAEPIPSNLSLNAEEFATSIIPDTELTELSELSSSEDFDDNTLTIIRKARTKVVSKTKVKQKPSTLSAKSRNLALSGSTALETPKIRLPGDYTRTPLLLSEPFSRWVDCGTCSSTWVQPNGYYTRKECPRCERHSKLYGYRWPKTERIKGERVGRVMDHRTVHRFVGPEEERRVRRRGKGCIGDVGVGVESIGEGGSEADGEEQVRETRRGPRTRGMDMA